MHAAGSLERSPVYDREGEGNGVSSNFMTKENTFNDINPSPTRFSELNELLINLVTSARNILGDNFIGVTKVT
ncbi:hypothetical protein SAMN04487897_1042 [Paenibacillus sp. yr247]|nr:hypothetical protein SAMN04487897_1042 [Paenibacillus sp. yr247]